MAKRGFMPGGGNMQGMLKQVQKMQNKMQKMQEEVEQRELETTTGGGAVTVKVNGKKEVLSISIKREVVDSDDVEMLEDLILTCVNQALSQVDDMVQKEMGKVTGGMNIPGLF